MHRYTVRLINRSFNRRNLFNGYEIRGFIEKQIDSSSL